MTRCLITGVGGFIGSHLAEFLVAEGVMVYGTVHSDTKNIEHLGLRHTILPCDILDGHRLKEIVAEVKPDVVVHLAAQALPALSWRDAQTTFDVNISGTLCLLEAIRAADGDPVVEIACSSAEYGFTDEREMPIKETTELRPASPYGVSKMAADLLSRLYWQAYGMKVVRMRPFLVVGPRKVGDVCSDFAKGVVAVENGQSDRLMIGNLAAVRDFVDVQDAVRAIWLLAEQGPPGEVYNVCSGVGHSVREVLDVLLSMANGTVPVEQDPARVRLSDEPLLVGDNSKLQALGWEPQVAFEKSLADVLAFWRRAAAAEAIAGINPI